jgi:hypothetical protein
MVAPKPMPGEGAMPVPPAEGGRKSAAVTSFCPGLLIGLPDWNPLGDNATGSRAPNFLLVIVPSRIDFLLGLLVIYWQYDIFTERGIAFGKSG